MSRTWHHGHREAWEKKLDTEYAWLSNEPRWWRKLKKHRVRRAAQRECIHKAMRCGYGYCYVSTWMPWPLRAGEEVVCITSLVFLHDSDEIVWPLDRKPWEYYW